MIGGLFSKNRRRREELLMRCLDGSLDAAGERELSDAARTDPALAREIAELEGVTALLKAQPDVPAPRSFALPYAPRPATANEGRGLLRWMQTATAATAVLLIALIGADIGGVGRDAERFSADPADSMETVGLASDSMAMQSESLTSEAAPVGAADPIPESMRQASGRAASAPDAASEAATAPLALEASDEAELGGDGEATGPSALRWAQLALGLTMVLLALGIVALRRRASRTDI